MFQNKLSDLLFIFQRIFEILKKRDRKKFLNFFKEMEYFANFAINSTYFY